MYPFKHISKNMHRSLKRYSEKGKVIWKFRKSGNYVNVGKDFYGKSVSEILENKYKLKNLSSLIIPNIIIKLRPQDQNRDASIYNIFFDQGLMQIGRSSEGGDWKRARVVRIKVN